MPKFPVDAPKPKSLTRSVNSKRASRERISAGILVYRWNNSGLEVLIAHPGGPFFAKKDEGHWTIPKGEPTAGEDLPEAAVREFSEEVGFVPTGPFMDLGSIQQKGGKIVFAWAVEAEVDAGNVVSNTFELEWPPKSGKMQEFPEVDRGAWFDVKTAKRKINPAQAALVDELISRV